MKVLTVNNAWAGGWLDHVAQGLSSLGYEIVSVRFERQNSLLRTMKLHNVAQIGQSLADRDIIHFNELVLQRFEETMPEMFLTMNQSRLLPSTIKHISERNCTTVCFIADNPFDSHRYTYLPVSLQYFRKLLVSDRIWIPGIKNVAPHSEIIKIPSGGGFNPDIFFPVEEPDITAEEREILSCDISFTGESYGMLAEGGYRAGIIDQLGSFNVQIWGDKGWERRFPYYSNLQRFYRGGRLSFDHLRKLYHLSTINLNMPAPQIFTGFQPRVFEIAACRGFQLVDWREELDIYFNKDELVCFKSTGELLEKADYFIKHPDERKPFVENAFNKARKSFTWEEQLKTLLPEILG